jgi:hypothetical protein
MYDVSMFVLSFSVLAWWMSLISSTGDSRYPYQFYVPTSNNLDPFQSPKCRYTAAPGLRLYCSLRAYLAYYFLACCFIAHVLDVDLALAIHVGLLGLSLVYYVSMIGWDIDTAPL